MTGHMTLRRGMRAGGLVVCLAAVILSACLREGVAETSSPAPLPAPAATSHAASGKPTAQPAPAGVTPQTGTSAVVMDLSAIESVIGKSVKSLGGEDLGRIVDLLVTPAGQVRAAVIDFGGVLGVGSRKVAVDWKALDFATVAKDGTVRLALTRNQVRVSPEYKSDNPVVILQATKPEEAKPEEAKPIATGSADKPADASSPKAPQASKQ